MSEPMCRTCLATCGDLVPIFSEDCYVDNLPDKLLKTIRIEVQEDDKLPKMICKKCIFLVDSLHCFKDQCEMAEMKLKQSLKTSLPSFSNVGQLLSACEANESSSGFNYDLCTSSEEDYQEIEYVSEEARMEVESAKRQKRNAKQENKKGSGVKVKSVEILPLETSSKIYKNFVIGSSTKNTNPIKEEATSDIEDRSSCLYSDEESSRYSSNTFDKNCNESFLSNKEPTYDVKSSIKEITKRKMEDDSSFNHLLKVPKKVMFKDDYYNADEDLHYMEITENQAASHVESLPTTKEDNSLQYNSMDVTSVKITQNSSETQDPLKIVMKSLPSIPPNENFQKVLETRMKTLLKFATLNFPEICTICTGSFESSMEVLKHKLESHLRPDQTCFFCPICHENFPSNQNLVDHVNVHQEVSTLICVLCSGCFYTEETLRVHLESHVDVHELKCNTCSKQFQQLHPLLSHLGVHVTADHLTCMLCPSKCNNKESLQSHLIKEHSKHLMHKNSKCETCGMRLSKRELIEHVKIHNSHICPYCQQSFILKESLGEHVSSHVKAEEQSDQQQQQQFKCFLCANSFATNDERTQHMQKQHMQPTQQQLGYQMPKPIKGDRKKFRCRVCHEILVSRYAYAMHLKDKHWNAKQTTEILRELSESSINERRNEPIKNDSIDSNT